MSIERLRLRIVGLPYHDAHEVWDACEAGLVANLVTLTPGNLIPLELRHEPTNPNDPKAIAVYLDPVHAGGRDYKLGYVPKQDAPTIHVMMAGAGHLGAAMDPADLEEPRDRTMWRGLMETDRPDLAAGKFKPKGTVPGPIWRNQALSASAQGKTVESDPSRGKAAPKKARPKRSKRLVHDWF